MQACIQFRLQKSIHRPMPVEPAHPGEFFGHDADPHMGFASSGDVGLVTGMLVAFVDHDEPLRFEFTGQKSFDPGMD